MKLNLKDSVLDEKGKEEQFTDVFSLRDEIGTCPFIEVHLKLKDETPFFVRPYPMREEQKKVIWITYIPLLMHGYGYECKSTDLATVCRSSFSR